MEDFNNTISAILKKQGRSQAWLAKQIDMGKVQVNHYCTNTTQPPLDKAYQIAEVLGVTLNDIVPVAE